MSVDSPDSSLRRPLWHLHGCAPAALAHMHNAARLGVRLVRSTQLGSATQSSRSLPCNTQNCLLPSTCITRCIFVLTDVRVGSVLENPPINPIQGLGRTHDDVQRERDAYQRRVRAQAQTSGGLEPVFQADFLLLRVHQKGVQLHRVANGMMICDAMEPEINFTTAEYKHTPQEGVDGLWGYFEPAANDVYDPTDKKTGTKYARLHNVGRPMILMYNVQVPPHPLKLHSIMWQMTACHDARPEMCCLVCTAHRLLLSKLGYLRKSERKIRSGQWFACPKSR